MPREGSEGKAPLPEAPPGEEGEEEEDEEGGEEEFFPREEAAGFDGSDSHECISLYEWRYGKCNLPGDGRPKEGSHREWAVGQGGTSTGLEEGVVGRGLMWGKVLGDRRVPL
jgi:hypothetical protein